MPKLLRILLSVPLFCKSVTSKTLHNEMRKLFSTYLFILFYFLNPGCANQHSNKTEIIHDTIYINKKSVTDSLSEPQLNGTTVLDASETNMESRWVHGLALVGLTSSECLQPQSETPAPTEITSVKQTNDSTLVITANINANCGYSFLGEIEIVSGNTINLIYHGYGGYASCYCCFGLTYTIEIFRDEDYKFDKLKYVTINGYAKTSLPKLK